MSRQTESLSLARELLDDIELDRLKGTAQLLKASRLARLVGTEDAEPWIGWELNGYPSTPEADEALTASSRDGSGDQEDWYAPLAAIEAHADAQRSASAALQGTSFSGDMLLPATNNHRKYVAQIAQVVGRCGRVIGAVQARIYDFALRTYLELAFSEAQASLFAATQAGIDAELAPMAGDALAKVDSVAARLSEGDPEAVSAAMNSCRRLVDAVADNLFSPQAEPYKLGEVSLAVGAANTLNRLQAFAHLAGANKSRRDRLRRAVADIYDRVSTGVHAEVSVAEARFLFLETYVVLGELLSLREDPVFPTPA